jgi:hypothetical protein
VIGLLLIGEQNASDGFRYPMNNKPLTHSATQKSNADSALALQYNLTLGLASIVAWDHCPERTLDSTQDWKDGTNGPILRHPKVKLF